MLTAEQLLAASHEEFEVEIPQALLGSEPKGDRRVRLRPLSINDLRLINRAARDNDDLTAALMVQRALVEPDLSAQQISGMSAGLLQYLLDQVNRISGIHASAEELSEAMQDPLAQASIRLAQEYGWTPNEIGQLTMGQVLMHLQMLQGHVNDYNA